MQIFVNIFGNKKLTAISSFISIVLIEKKIRCKSSVRLQTKILLPVKFSMKQIVRLSTLFQVTFKAIHQIFVLILIIKTLSTVELEDLSFKICEVFPGEVATTYYQKFCQGRHAHGKLHDAYNNYRTSLAAAGLIVRRSKSKTRVVETLDLDRDLQQLSTDIDIKRCQQPWKKTSDYRIQLLNSTISTSDYIKTCPVLEQCNAYELILIDVELKYKKTLNITIPDAFYSSIIRKTKNIRSQTVEKIISLINNENDETQKSLLALMLVPFYFPTTTLRGKNINLHEGENFYSQINSLDTNQPRIILIGVPIQLSWVLVAHIKYCFPTIEKALVCAMSAYLGLNIKYPPVSEKAWFFLQKHMFQISTAYDNNLESRISTYIYSPFERT
ncbi:uncharacterized protein LOC119682936 [Teleopsis dalmanni]|uniref:uncharacterized protein LOC119682936 n=1 Tax=Teleopsis dalmanni TaxID=139649 RepID=UPI0018CD5146|nr:uncharacterized protein LOC119682936 [Teleopsis dalmanni]